MSQSVIGDGARLASSAIRLKPKPSRSHTAFGHANGFLSALIERFAEAKVRRLQRELALRGVRSGFSERESMPQR